MSEVYTLVWVFVNVTDLQTSLGVCKYHMSIHSDLQTSLGVCKYHMSIH